MKIVDRAEVMAIVESWTVEERIAFVQDVCDRIALGQIDSDMTDERKAELDRRVAAFRANRERAIPWEQVYAETIARVRR